MSRLARYRVLPCTDPFCMCLGEGHPCLDSECSPTGDCHCQDCSLCGAFCATSDLTVDAEGEPVGQCCEHRLDDAGWLKEGGAE